MGAKKGKGGGPFAFCMRVLYIPFYYPTYWFLWFVVELIGGQKIPLISKTLMEKKWIKDGVKFLKEFRGVLQQYLGMPGAAKPSGNCKNCGQKAKFWCMDCSKKFCPQCALHQHPPGTSSEQHSIEELCDNWSRDGVHILSPILPEIMAVLASLWMFTYVPMFEENYLTRADMCPVVSSFRQASAYLDPHLFYWYKASFTSWCNYEDSFWKLLTDAWVRGIVTETDSSLLVFMNLPQALLFEVVVVIVMVPIISVMYALLLNVVLRSSCTSLIQISLDKLNLLPTSSISQGTNTSALHPQRSRIWIVKRQTQSHDGGMRLISWMRRRTGSIGR
jgi:hypothetical protein